MGHSQQTGNFMYYDFNPLIPNSDYHVTSPFDIPYILQQTGNMKSYQVEVFILIKYRILP